MKDVEFDIIVPDDEPTAELLETEEVEALATPTEDAEQTTDAPTGKHQRKANAQAESQAEEAEESHAPKKAQRPMGWKQLIIDEDIRFNKQMLRDLFSGVSLVGFLHRNWLFLLLLVAYFIIYTSLGYHHGNLLIENDKLNRELLDRRYKALTRSSELRERTLGSKIEGQLQDTTLQTSTDAPYVLPVESEE